MSWRGRRRTRLRTRRLRAALGGLGAPTALLGALAAWAAPAAAAQDGAGGQGSPLLLLLGFLCVAAMGAMALLAFRRGEPIGRDDGQGAGAAREDASDGSDGSDGSGAAVASSAASPAPTTLAAPSARAAQASVASPGRTAAPPRYDGTAAPLPPRPAPSLGQVGGPPLAPPPPPAPVVEQDWLAWAKEGISIDGIRATLGVFAEKGMTRTGRGKSLSRQLERAASRFRPGEWVVMAAGGALAAALFGYLLGGVPVALLLAVGVLIGFRFRLGMMAERRQHKFADQLPETLQLIAGGMRAGYSLPQALQTVADESPSPTGEEFLRVINENRVGRDLAESLRGMAQRMESEDFRWVVNAMEINREVGGDLALVLDRVSETIRKRNRVRGQVKALSAEGRLSGIVMMALPPVMFVVVSLVNPDYIHELTGRFVGWLMLGAATVLLLVGGLWIKKLCKFVY